MKFKGGTSRSLRYALNILSDPFPIMMRSTSASSNASSDTSARIEFMYCAQSGQNPGRTSSAAVQSQSPRPIINFRLTMPYKDDNRPPLPDEITKPNHPPMLINDLQKTRIKQHRSTRRCIFIERLGFSQLSSFPLFTRFSRSPGSGCTFGDFYLV